MADLNAEELRVALEAEARRRFGEGRARALASELDALAGDLARVEAAPLPPDGEPGFFLGVTGDPAP